MNRDVSDERIEKLAGRLSNIVLLGFLTVLCSLPVITAGASLTALNKATHEMVNGEDKPLRIFLSAFKEQFKPATILFLIHFVLIAVFAVDLIWYRAGTSILDIVAQSAVFVLLVVAVWDLILTLILLSLGETKEIGKLFRKAGDLVVYCPFETLSLLLLAVAISLAAFFLFKGALVILPGIIAYCHWQIVPEMLKKYKFKKGNREYQKNKENQK
ncbi:MAG: YesL family protein [Erysipelotrichaceae bacterium]|nr:YesL family protein [Erysipelotrichaceae bacterium]